MKAIERIRALSCKAFRLDCQAIPDVYVNEKGR